jgi:glycosyltransferase involved in cell wall biosynthesis
MRIVIDMQGAQSTDSRHRGIGRYTLSLAQAIARNRGEHDIFLALNGSFPDTIETIRVAFEGLLPQENIRVWQVPGTVFGSSTENDYLRRSAELIREAFLASFKPDIVLVSSLFEGLSDNAVTSIGMLSRTIPTAVILYDLIPLVQRRLYLENPVVEAWYENKLGHMRRADMLLAISESSRQEGIQYLGFPVNACVNISTAADQQFRPQQIDSKKEVEVRQRYGLNQPFVMYTGGIDHRKNIEGLIRAYALLPKALRAAHQLAIVCSIQSGSRVALEKLAKEQGLKPDELVLTGFVPEEDLLALYNLCKAFIFPSWHEGFGLPALEAMSCGRAVISANTSSLPEVIGRDDALFDPMSDRSIAGKLEEVLTNDVFRSELERHGLEQARRFSWNNSARRAIAAFETWDTKKIRYSLTDTLLTTRRPRLAYVSPLPPERSGISDYSAELLPELSRHYDIDVIVAQDSISNPWIKTNCSLRSEEWFRAHAGSYDRVLYHFGNSPFHQHMFGLLEEVPGVVVLHDFFLSSIISHMDFTGYRPDSWIKTLYQSHGYSAVQKHFHASDNTEAVWHYPCNLDVLQNSLGVIVHSENSRRLAVQWYGKGAANDWAIIPHLRVPKLNIARAEARCKLKLGNDDFVVCSFGMLGPTKLNHRLLHAWLASTLAKNVNCVLVFVGENHGGEYGKEFANTIRQSGLDKRIRITGWADTDTFRHYLSAADVGVQLRTQSRGETSGTVLDCMNYGLPTVVNANGSMVDLPDDGVLKLPDEFDDAELIAALETLWFDPERRQQLGGRAREIILEHHTPRTCADQYAQAIETMYSAEQTGLSALTHAIAGLELMPKDAQSWGALAEAMALAVPPRIAFSQLLVDVSILVQHDAKSGIQRVVRSILKELLTNPPEGYRVEPVYATPETGYRYARRFTFSFLGFPEPPLEDDPIDYYAGDVLLCLDLSHQLVISRQADFERLRNHGVQIWFTVYDLLPIVLPKAFPDGVEHLHRSWLSVIAKVGDAVCISKAVADELAEWCKMNATGHRRSFKIDWFHLGADINASMPSKGMPDNAKAVLNTISAHPSFLMVGTLEPRKRHSQTLDAFEILWKQGIEVNLVIVGKQGWKMDSLIDRLYHHPGLSKNLFWLDGISDEYLGKIYAASTCLIAASEGEGFGLPLIESAQHKLPIIARDIPVFREVAGEHAYYFSGLGPSVLATTIKQWLELDSEDKAPQSDGMSWLTWQQSVQQLLVTILPNNTSILKNKGILN